MQSLPSPLSNGVRSRMQWRTRIGVCGCAVCVWTCSVCGCAGVDTGSGCLCAGSGCLCVVLIQVLGVWETPFACFSHWYRHEGEKFMVLWSSHSPHDESLQGWPGEAYPSQWGFQSAQSSSPPATEVKEDISGFKLSLKEDHLSVTTWPLADLSKSTFLKHG